MEKELLDKHFPFFSRSMFSAEFAAARPFLISFGAVLGKVSPLQLIIMALFEIPIYVANEYIGVTIFQVINLVYVVNK